MQFEGNDLVVCTNLFYQYRNIFCIFFSKVAQMTTLICHFSELIISNLFSALDECLTENIHQMCTLPYVAFCKKMQTVNCDYLHTIQTHIMALLRK